MITEHIKYTLDIPSSAEIEVSKRDDSAVDGYYLSQGSDVIHFASGDLYDLRSLFDRLITRHESDR